MKPPGAKPPKNARFWSLTPYYFVAVPFVFADRGVILAREGETEFEGRTYDLVRATFEAGTGDAPDDFYVILIDRETRRIGGVRYVVSYPGFFPDGGHGKESFMVFDGAQTVDGITLPQTFRTFRWEDSKLAELLTNTTLTDVSFAPDTPSSYFDVPEGAERLKGY